MLKIVIHPRTMGRTFCGMTAFNNPKRAKMKGTVVNSVVVGLYTIKTK